MKNTTFKSLAHQRAWPLAGLLLDASRLIMLAFQKITYETRETSAGSNTEVIKAYLNHTSNQTRLKLYVPYLVNQIASKFHYHCETQPTIIYAGNLKTEMMAFRFFLKFDHRTTAPREPRERISQIINTPLIEIDRGVQKICTLGLPKLRNAEIFMRPSGGYLFRYPGSIKSMFFPAMCSKILIDQ